MFFAAPARISNKKRQANTSKVISPFPCSLVIYPQCSKTKTRHNTEQRTTAMTEKIRAEPRPVDIFPNNHNNPLGPVITTKIKEKKRGQSIE